MLLDCSCVLVTFELMKSVFVPVLFAIESVLQVLVVFLLTLQYHITPPTNDNSNPASLPPTPNDDNPPPPVTPDNTVPDQNQGQQQPGSSEQTPTPTTSSILPIVVRRLPGRGCSPEYHVVAAVVCIRNTLPSPTQPSTPSDGCEPSNNCGILAKE